MANAFLRKKKKLTKEVITFSLSSKLHASQKIIMNFGGLKSESMKWCFFGQYA